MDLSEIDVTFTSYEQIEEIIEECDSHEEALREDIASASEAGSVTCIRDAVLALENWLGETEEARKELKAAERELRRGTSLIPEANFVDYAAERVRDADGVDLKAWPFNCIDWERAADELKHDYSAIEIMGATYYYID